MFTRLVSLSVSGSIWQFHRFFCRFPQSSLSYSLSEARYCTTSLSFVVGKSLYIVIMASFLQKIGPLSGRSPLFNIYLSGIDSFNMIQQIFVK